jgi:hypothetical protein
MSLCLGLLPGCLFLFRIAGGGGSPITRGHTQNMAICSSQKEKQLFHPARWLSPPVCGVPYWSAGHTTGNDTASTGSGRCFRWGFLCPTSRTPHTSHCRFVCHMEQFLLVSSFSIRCCQNLLLMLGAKVSPERDRH